jgi:hypothetical protein
MSFVNNEALWLDDTLQPITSAAVGEEVSFVYYGETSAPETGAVIAINAAPDGFVPTDWSITPNTSPSGSPLPIIYAAGSVITVGNTNTLPAIGTEGVGYLITGSFTTPGTKTFSVTLDTTQSTAVTAGASLVVNDASYGTANLNLGLPLTCATGLTGWSPDFSAGKLVFVDNSNYTIPNYAVRFTEKAAFELHVATLEGSDVDTINSRVAYPRRERNRTARIACQMLFGVDKDGSAYNDLQRGMTVNWSELTALSDQSWSTTNGLQTVHYTPWIGASVYQFEAHVIPPVVGSVQMGVGMAFGLILEVPNPAAVLP